MMRGYALWELTILIIIVVASLSSSSTTAVVFGKVILTSFITNTIAPTAVSSTRRPVHSSISIPVTASSSSSSSAAAAAAAAGVVSARTKRNKKVAAVGVVAVAFQNLLPHRRNTSLRVPNASRLYFASNCSNPAEKEEDEQDINIIRKSNFQYTSMEDFFKTHNEWKPLFQHIIRSPSTSSSSSPPSPPTTSSALASSLLLSLATNSDSNNRGIEMNSNDIDDIMPTTNNKNNNSASTSMINLWGLSTLEQRHPWRLLPSKPSSDASLRALANFLDVWQQSLLDIPLDELITGENDARFLEEGRRTIAVTRFHVLDEYNTNRKNSSSSSSSANDQQQQQEEEKEEEKDEFERRVNECDYYDWKMELFRTCWSEIAHLTQQDSSDTGSLVLLPDWINETIIGTSKANSDTEGGLKYVEEFVENNLVQPISWLGREEEWEISAMQRGGLAVRMLYKLSAIPQLDRTR